MNLNLSSDHGQGRHVHVIFALLYYKKCHSCALNTSLSVWRLCDRLWHRWLVSRQPAVPPALSVRWGFRHWRHWRFSIMKISSVASGASFCVEMTATLSRWTTSEPSMRLNILTTKQLSHPTVISLSIFYWYFSLVFYDVKYFYYKYYT